MSLRHVPPSSQGVNPTRPVPDPRPDSLSHNKLARPSSGTGRAPYAPVMSNRVILLACVLALLGCGAPTAPTPQDELVQARARWEEQKLESYRFELTRSCYCVLGGRSMTVTVEQDEVAAAEYTDSGAAIERELLSYVPTVPDLFDLIADGLSRPMARFVASYDPVAGYPTRIQLDYSAAAVDDEMTIVVRNLVALREVSR